VKTGASINIVGIVSTLLCVHKARKVYYKSKFDKYQNNPKQAWRTINEILRRKKQDTTINEVRK
jgi:hypothetical protein